ncbi:DNA-directed RNA polymerase subunit beta [Trifolium repens]|nr:DNA-directed RNA polymerase subunit beta [Trifolium repens]
MSMLERTLSSRRGNSQSDADAINFDESKTKKQQHILFRLTNRASTYISRTPQCILCIAIALLLLLALSFFYTSRKFVCISSSSFYKPASRAAFFGLDGLDSDFGTLGVPCCRSKHGKTVEWTSKDLLKGLEEFVPIYETRPIQNNMYGMGFDHSFGLWFIARWLKPDLMIESGAFKGHSTWVLRQAMPDTRIVSLSPRHPEKYLKKGPAYVDGNCTYYAGKDFVDFGSVDWPKVMSKHGIKDRSRVLIFFDDHQNELKRIEQALKAGFRHLVFEDNYDTGTGDHYSLRQICDQFYIRGGGHSCFKDSDEARIRSRRKQFWEKAVDIEELCGPGEVWWGVRGYMRDNFNHSNKPISYAQHFQNSRYVESILDVYWELPPVAGPSLTHQTRYDPARAPNPIVEDGRYGLFQRLGLGKFDNSVFNGYTQMVYLQISEQ